MSQAMILGLRIIANVLTEPNYYPKVGKCLLILPALFLN
jgi:hypothetical protein